MRLIVLNRNQFDKIYEIKYNETINKCEVVIMSDDKYLIHDDSEYEILKPENFAKLSEKQKEEIMTILNNTTNEIKRND